MPPPIAMRANRLEWPMASRLFPALLLLPLAASAEPARNERVHQAIAELSSKLLAALPAGGAPGAKPRLAVVEFESASEGARSADLGRTVSELLTARLAGEPSIVLVERERVDRALAEQRLGRT